MVLCADVALGSGAGDTLLIPNHCGESGLFVGAFIVIEALELELQVIPAPPEVEELGGVK